MSSAYTVVEAFENTKNGLLAWGLISPENLTSEHCDFNAGVRGSCIEGQTNGRSYATDG